ncbi:/ CDC50 family protein, LEM3 family [Oesophagostomum dentatum]|uniref:/ CDC50 family protein, LEM3 family n=1 Tax=Oesophagostomum dentatum TaxID=61180 RepID=A0A0B1TUC9_OESDE|nr:/ CDC50 family protein, LEM3 family [Oesophagostomum dentatum]
MNAVPQTQKVGDIKFYYGLHQFYQNNRLYVNSRNDLQLIGNLDEVSDCKPLDQIPDTNLTYAPCGFVANSMFNDTFQLLYHGAQGGSEEVPFTTRTMIPDLVRKRKFRNPKPVENETLCDAFVNTVRPPWWQKDICKLGANIPGVGVGFENVDFMIWMQTAALPNFRKLYRVLDRDASLFTTLLRFTSCTDIFNPY